MGACARTASVRRRRHAAWTTVTEQGLSSENALNCVNLSSQIYCVIRPGTVLGRSYDWFEDQFGK